MTVHRGILTDFDSGTFTATVRLDGAHQTVLTNVRCTRLDSAVFVADRRVLVDTGDHWDATDAVIIAVYT